MLWNYCLTDLDLQLQTLTSKKDLGVTFDQTLSCGQHLSENVAKANYILRISARTFECEDRKIILPL